MSSRKPPGLLALPRELLDGIFQQFYPESSVDLSDPFDDLDTPQCCIRSIAADRAALARCARVCRHLYIPAVATLWREQLMDHVCMATLSEWTYGSVKWPAGDMWGLDVESDEDDDMNHDVAVGGAAGHYDYRYPYVSGPPHANYSTPQGKLKTLSAYRTTYPGRFLRRTGRVFSTTRLTSACSDTPAPGRSSRSCSRTSNSARATNPSFPTCKNSYGCTQRPSWP